MTARAETTWVVTIDDPESGGWLTEIAVRAPRASAAARLVRGAGVHRRAMRPGAQSADPVLPWPEDSAVVFLRRRLGWGEDAEWRPVTGDRLL